MEEGKTDVMDTYKRCCYMAKKREYQRSICMTAGEVRT